jgi:acetyl-CoA synthetase
VYDNMGLEQRVADLLVTYQGAHVDVAELLCDRHPPNASAYTIVAKSGEASTLTFGALAEASRRVAGGLRALGVGRGDRVATLLDKSVEQLVAMLAIWRLGAVQVPLFTAFAPSAIATRLEGSGAVAVVCDEGQRPKLDTVASETGERYPAWRVVTTGPPTAIGDVTFASLAEADIEPSAPAPAGGDAPIVLLYTSGTTGRPKGVLVPARALAAFHAYMEFGLGVTADDVFWNAADPGWAYGLYYGPLGGLAMGVPGLWVQGSFSAERTFTTLAQFGITNFAAAPTVYRGLRISGVEVPSDLQLRRASAAGEPLTPDINRWARSALGVEVHDHYGQTETGMLVNNHQHPSLASLPLKSGSMGRIMPGWTTAVLQDSSERPVPVGAVGRLAIDIPASPFAWFDGYLDEPERSAEKFSKDGRWYFTGDAARVDSSGDHYFVSRDDDLIIMAGYRIGPFEVESALLEHGDVVEVAAVAAPDELRGEVVEAYVVLTDGREGSPQLVSALQELVKTRYAAHAYPRRIHFVPELPRTPSGKVQRFRLRDATAGSSAAGR